MSEKVEKGRLKKYGKEYGKYAACVVTGFALYGAAEVNRKLGDPARNAILERKRYGDSPALRAAMPSENDTAKEIVSMIFWWMDWEKGRRKSQSRSRSEKCRQMKCRKSFRRSWNA